MSTCKRMKFDPYLKQQPKINSKWFKDLNVRRKTVILLKENIGENFRDVGSGNEFLDMTPKAQATKLKIG